eukprot:1195061-Prorocentrum_minimum.AAC.5
MKLNQYVHRTSEKTVPALLFPDHRRRSRRKRLGLLTAKALPCQTSVWGNCPAAAQRNTMFILHKKALDYGEWRVRIFGNSLGAGGVMVNRLFPISPTWSIETSLEGQVDSKIRGC